ncbi:MAG: hypothetical protein ACRDL3_06540 [Solirubrobacterales bacterium]
MAIACVPALTASGKPSANYETKVRISERSPAFHGRVQSTFEPCEKRRVRLVKKGEDGNKVMGEDRTDGKGTWKVRVDELTLKSGTYYAWAGRKKVGRKIFVCKPDRSRAIVID